MVSKLFLVLAALSGLVAAVGFVWAVLQGGRGLRNQVPETGTATAEGSAPSSWPVWHDQDGRTSPRTGGIDQGPGEDDAGTRPPNGARDSGHGDRSPGTAAGGGFLLADAGRLLRTGHGRQALPGLLLGGGLLGLLLFGALVLLTSLPGKWLGLAALAIAVIIAFGELREFLTT